MKRFILSLVAIIITSVCFAQDIIVQKDGSIIQAKVLEVGTTEVKYKKWSNQDGPSYAIAKSNILAITYQNGEKESFNDQPVMENLNQHTSTYNNDVLKALNAGNSIQKQKLLASAKNWRVAGKVIYWGGFLGTIGGCLAFVDDKIPYVPLTVGILSSIGLGAVCNHIADNKESAAHSIASIHIIQQDYSLGSNRLTAGVDYLKCECTNERTIGLGLSFSF